MKAWILPVERRVAPFGDVASLPVLNRTLREAQIAEIAAAGMTFAGGEPGDGVRIAGDVFVNAAALRAMRPGRMRLRAPGWAKLAGGPEVRDVDVAIPGGSIAELDADERALSLARGRDEMAIAAPRLVAAKIETWNDLLWVNLVGMASRVVGMSPAKGVSLVLYAAIRSLSLNPWRIAGALVEKGKGCDVHPSATVEASVLGAGVRIGPGAVVRNSILGDGVDVEELALVSGSVIGKQSIVERCAFVKFSVTGERALAGGAIQLSVLGDGAALRFGSYTMDRPLGGERVRIATDAGLVEAGPALGVALGPGASVGTGVWIAPGRALPGGVIVTRGPQDVLARIPPAMEPGVYGVEGGTVVKR